MKLSLGMRFSILISVIAAPLSWLTLFGFPITPLQFRPVTTLIVSTTMSAMVYNGSPIDPVLAIPVAVVIGLGAIVSLIFIMGFAVHLMTRKWG